MSEQKSYITKNRSNNVKRSTIIYIHIFLNGLIKIEQLRGREFYQKKKNRGRDFVCPLIGINHVYSLIASKPEHIFNLWRENLLPRSFI